MHLIPDFSSWAAPHGPAAMLRALWSRLTASLPHLSLIAVVAGLIWRAALVAEPAGLLVHVPYPAAVSPPPAGELVILSANLKHDFPLYREMEARLEAFAQLVESQKADVLLLQEVARTADFDAAAWLHDRLGMAYVYARANGHRDGIGFEEGSAVFSRFPIGAPEVRDLTGGESLFSRRIGLNASVLLPNGTIEVFSVHLGLGSGGNRSQIERLLEWAGGQPAGVLAVIGGDFNAGHQTERIKAVRSKWTDAFYAGGSVGTAVTHVLAAPWGTPLRAHRLDYVFLQNGGTGWQVGSAEHLASAPIPHSDHRAVVVRLRK